MQSSNFKIVAFLQNMWVKDPVRIQGILDLHPHSREFIIRHLLFRKCRTGKILKATLGTQLCELIVWEETTMKVAGDATTIFPPDYDHIQRVINKHSPDVVIGMGKVAAQAVFKVANEMMRGAQDFQFNFFSVPHPCARPAQDPIGALTELKQKLQPYLS